MMNKKVVAAVLSASMVLSMAMPAFAMTPQFKAPQVPSISSITIKSLPSSVSTSISNAVNQYFANLNK